MWHSAKLIWQEDDGVLSFEWTLLIVLLVFGIISGIGAIRDVVLDELSDHAQAVLAFDQSYSFAGIPGLGIPPSQYTDHLGTVTDCDRFAEPGFEIIPVLDSDDGG